MAKKLSRPQTKILLGKRNQTFEELLPEPAVLLKKLILIS